MAHEQDFWQMEPKEDGHDFWVCINCLNEVFWRKIPKPDCPSCHRPSTYEPFTLDNIQGWGDEEIIAKARLAKSEAVAAILARSCKTSEQSAEGRGV